MTAVSPVGEVLRIADGVALPTDYVTMTAAILAQRRKGKTYAACVIAEELYDVGIPWVALDPTGAWWGLRSGADGDSPGLPVVVIGGQHGDLPLEREAGAFVADLVVDHPGWYVIDLSLLESRAAEREFATAFAQRLHRRKMQPGMDFPLHLFVDEADLFVPQEKEHKGDVALLGAFQGIVRRGGLHGLGSTLISQRPALVNKSVLTQLDLLILLRLVAGQDQDAVGKNYVSRFLGKEQSAEVMGSLATLAVGEAWFLEPGAEPPRVVRARVRERRTFNSSATPRPGEQRVEPSVFADVDLDDLRTRMADSIERYKADDPAELRRLYTAQSRVLELEAERERIAADVQAAARPGSPDLLPEWETYFREDGWLPADEVPTPETVPVIDASTLQSLSIILDRGESLATEAEEYAVGIRASFAQVAERVAEAQAPPAGREATTTRRVMEARPSGASSPHSTAAVAAPTPAPDPPAWPADGVTGPQQRILDALAWWETVGVDLPRVDQVAFVVGYHPRSKGFTNNLSALSTAGLVERQPGVVGLTPAGADAARRPASTPTEAELRRLIYDQVGGKRASLLEAIVARGASGVSMDELAEEMGYHPRSKGFTNNVSTLSGLGLVDRSPGRVAASDLCYLR